jgi:hypothetical protein
MPVRELLARTTSRELTEWQAYERVTGPLDLRLRTEIAASIVAATVHNASGTKTRAKAADFMPVWFRRKRSARDLWQQVMKVNTALGGDYQEAPTNFGS